MTNSIAQRLRAYFGKEDIEYIRDLGGTGDHTLDCLSCILAVEETVDPLIQELLGVIADMAVDLEDAVNGKREAFKNLKKMHKVKHDGRCTKKPYSCILCNIEKEIKEQELTLTTHEEIIALARGEKDGND